MIKRTTAYALTALLAATMLTAGCSSTPRGLGHVPSRPSDKNLDAPQTVEVAAFAHLAGEIPAAQSTLANTPVGFARVTVVGEYMNGLGERCRKVQLDAEGNVSRRAAVCRDAEGVWRYVAPLQ
ncbi:DVU3141 family protein [Sutterella sp.]|uniref:DVU3141 family protein n=1 Tax=Sutterella sp. TaxID=1981025 RepID=UPI0026DF40FB|nr:DVU3141 family protein [Sutterella sp.]MDO5531769.1 hypothetical protein [Sutterella sp.]